MIHWVREFHVKFGLPDGGEDKLITGTPEGVEAAVYRIKFLQEELDEFVEAVNNGNHVKAFDALLDLAYVTYGTALFAGITPAMWVEGMTAVHQANMAKVRAQHADQSKRGSTFDVVKPEGWVSPEQRLAEVLKWRR